MYEHVGELVMAADVIVVAVRRDGGDRLVDEIRQLVGQAHQTHPGVDDQIAIAAADVPDVAAHQRDDVRFPQQGDRIVDRGPIEPVISDRQDGHVSGSGFAEALVRGPGLSGFGFLARLGATRDGSPAIFG